MTSHSSVRVCVCLCVCVCVCVCVSHENVNRQIFTKFHTYINP